MTRMSDLPGVLVDKILTGVPMTSLGPLRSTCKTWNDSSKLQIFGKAARKKHEFLGFLLIDHAICSMRFPLDGDNDPSIHEVKNLVLDDGNNNPLMISDVFHWGGLLLCVINDRSSLVVWNPYLGKSRRIKPRCRFFKFHKFDIYALGYNSYGNHKILRFLDKSIVTARHMYSFGYEIYDVKSDSWSVFEANPEGDILRKQRSVSLKGNAYFLTKKEKEMVFRRDGYEDQNYMITEVFLLCFDFTREEFGPGLSLPMPTFSGSDDDTEETVTLSSVRDEQLVVLYQHYGVFEIWITDWIESNSLSWSIFLKVDITPLNGFPADFKAGSFFIDEEEQVAVVFDQHGFTSNIACPYQTAHIIGKNRYLRSVNMREAGNLGEPKDFGYSHPLVCTSYVPSLVSLEITKRRKRRS